MIFEFLLLLINIEAVTNLISKSEIFKPLRAFLFKHSKNKIIKFIHDLVDCPYCTSVWVSFFYITLITLCGLSTVIMFFMLVISMHRMSNVLHHIIDRIDRNSGYDVLMDKENDKK